MQVANTLGINTVLRNAVFPLDITHLNDPDLDLALLETGGTVSVLEMTQAYAVFAAMGDVFDLRRLLPPSAADMPRQPIAVRRIEDAQGNLLWEYDATISQVPRLDSEVAYVINDILADDTTRWGTLGQGNILEMTRPTAVVAGMTKDMADSWTIGYTPNVVVGVHLARGTGGSTSLTDFGINAAPVMWRAIMDYTNTRDSLPADNWPLPAEIVQAPVCEISGLAPNGVCDTRNELFIREVQVQTLPTDTYWREVEINSDTNRLATVNTPDALRRQVVYFVPPDEALDWWQLENRPLPPTQSDTSNVAPVLRTAAITSPGELDVVGGIVEVRGSMSVSELASFQVAYGEGFNPVNWINISDRRTQFDPTVDPLLTTWDANGLDGLYTLRLQVELTDGTFDNDFVQVVVDNVAPTVVLLNDDPAGTVYRWPGADVIPLVAEVNDQYMGQVEFYHNGAFVGVDPEPPYAWDFEITGVGTEEFLAVAIDQVGNQTQSLTLRVDILRAGG